MDSIGARIRELEEVINTQKIEIFRLNEVVSNLPGSIYWKDKDGVYLGRNKYAMEKMKSTNLDTFSIQDDVIGKTDYDFFPREVADNYRKHDLAVINSGRELSIEESVTLPDGQTIIQLSTKHPLYDVNGQIWGIVGNTVDITKLKKVEEELRVAKQLAESANKAKSAFIANISHDLRNAMSGVILLAQGMIGDEKERTLENAQMIHDSGMVLLNLMNNVLDFVRVENPDFRALQKDEKFSLSSVVNDLRALYATSMHAKDLKFDIVLAEDMPIYLISKPFLIHKILMNLIGNAMKFTDTGGVTISISLKQQQDTPILTIAVADTGIGIPAEKREAVFGWFERLTPSYKGVYQGTGMGLATVKEAINGLQGKISISDNKPQGTIFTCEIPVKIANDLTEAEAAETYITQDDIAEVSSQQSHQTKHHTPEKMQQPQTQTEPEVSIDELTGGKNLLLIEDVPLAAKAATVMLETAGFSVDWADTGEKGLTMILTGKYDVVLSDIGLPDMNGTDVVRQARAAYTRVPIYALTGHADMDRDELLKIGFNDVMVKPFKLPLFLNLLKQRKAQADQPMTSHKVIDFETGIALEYDHETTLDMLHTFLDMVPGTTRKLKSAIDKADIAKIRDALHELRGGACYAPAPELIHILEIAHEKVKSLTDDEITQDNLTNIFTDSFAAIDRLLAAAKGL